MVDLDQCHKNAKTSYSFGATSRIRWTIFNIVGRSAGLTEWHSMHILFKSCWFSFRKVDISMSKAFTCLWIAVIIKYSFLTREYGSFPVRISCSWFTVRNAATVQNCCTWSVRPNAHTSPVFVAGRSFSSSMSCVGKNSIAVQAVDDDKAAVVLIFCSAQASVMFQSQLWEEHRLMTLRHYPV